MVRVTSPSPSVFTAASFSALTSILASFRVTLAVAFLSATMVTVLSVEASASRLPMTGAESSFVTLPWLTVWPLSVALTVISPSSKYQLSASAAVGKNAATSSAAARRVNILLCFIRVPPLRRGRPWALPQPFLWGYDTIDRGKIQERIETFVIQYNFICKYM